jgi:hypothetical protein
MSWQDLVNGAFEIGGGLMVLLHCRQLYRDKQVRGASWIATAFFASWGWWNLYYYPHLNQWLSFAGGVVIVLANTLWVFMMLYYIRRERVNQLTKMKLHQAWVERVTRETLEPESPSTIP